jgi:cytochrome c-type biogenesis protein CcmH
VAACGAHRPGVHVTRRTASWIVLAAVVIVAAIVLIAGSRPDESADARSRRLQHQLACPECAGSSVADSNSPTARAMRDDIVRRIAAGERDADIRAAYVAKYGNKVLLMPANSGIGLVAWMLPLVVLFLGVAGIAVALRRWSRAPRLAATSEDEAIVAAARGHEADPAE